MCPRDIYLRTVVIYDPNEQYLLTLWHANMMIILVLYYSSSCLLIVFPHLNNSTKVDISRTHYQVYEITSPFYNSVRIENKTSSLSYVVMFSLKQTKIIIMLACHSVSRYCSFGSYITIIHSI
jgi:hypothetical protein